MPSIEKKIIKNKPFFYLSEQVRIAGKNKKIQVYVGRSIPNDLSLHYTRLSQKEREFIAQHEAAMFRPERTIQTDILQWLEDYRVLWKYALAQKSPEEQERLWRRFLIAFIFESNAIEGSRLSQKEVESIVRKQYIKKSLGRKEILEVRNAIRAFEFIRSAQFQLNERSLIRLHALVTRGLGVQQGFKKRQIIVNNKRTTPPGHVRASLSGLASWWRAEQKTKRHPLFFAADFHSRFELIHPFEDGNGRVGRLLFVWMMMQKGYPPLLFRYRNRRSYFGALNQADEGRTQKWYWLCVRVYKDTARWLLTL
ncbi:MAG: hypothetical protein A3C90_03155 [Candidatus Magasanikbacteria bacterium RIFCSPHIGHO2_02_FULL_51_14]|uniref:Fido domain-containing protein n=1 Tax=Candidatus Magasanikbacteria bacterium RIFCSPHIGHO2_02_FULL_51_14 TaxID=1798683 RepID=A0A1F6MPI1_9BACT|nr:MAG: hypothetical protein A3C90_03155 [Candidatus Magasanikbacteria bacterium RIFCSPHIGHO2_02_FULL_51_14]